MLNSLLEVALEVVAMLGHWLPAALQPMTLFALDLWTGNRPRSLSSLLVVRVSIMEEGESSY